MKYIRLSVIAVMLLLSSCSRYYYAPALLRSDIAYVAKPASYDSVKKAIYVSAGIGSSMGANLSDEITYGTVDVSAGHVLKNFNIGYGAFAYGGRIKNTNNNNDVSNLYPLNSKTFSAVGGRFSANLYSARQRANFRYLGFEAVYSKEFGDYLDYRRMVNGKENYYAITGTDLLSMGLTSEIIWRNRREHYTQYGIRVFIGGRYLNYKFSDANIYSRSTNGVQFDLSYFMKYRHFIGSVNTNLFTSSALRLGYSF